MKFRAKWDSVCGHLLGSLAHLIAQQIEEAKAFGSIGYEAASAARVLADLELDAGGAACTPHSAAQVAMYLCRESH
jgi:hypothetical protein